MGRDFYNTKDKVSEYIEMAKGINGKALIERLQLHIKDGDSVLELGSGPGSDYEILRQRYRVLGSDFSPEFVHYLQNKFPNERFEILDAASLDIAETFNAIYSNKVLHHLTDAELKSSIANQSHILYKNGIVCHSFWKGEGTEDFKGMLVNLHTKEELHVLFSSAFEILHLEEYQEFEPNDSIIIIAKKK